MWYTAPVLMVTLLPVCIVIGPKLPAFLPVGIVIVPVRVFAFIRINSSVPVPSTPGPPPSAAAALAAASAALVVAIPACVVAVVADEAADVADDAAADKRAAPSLCHS